MPVVPFIPLIAAGVGTAGSVYAAKKAANAAKLPPAQSAQQTQAMEQLAARSAMVQPLLQQLTTGMQSRLPASYGGARSSYLPAPSQLASPGAGQAVSRLARAMPPPNSTPSARYGQVPRERIIWGDRREQQ